MRSTLYRNGAVCAAGSDYYYQDDSRGWSGGLVSGYRGYGNYSSKVVTGAYNGNGYSYYYGFISPNYTH